MKKKSNVRLKYNGFYKLVSNHKGEEDVTKNLRKLKEEIKKKLPYLITLSYGLSIRYVYADGKSDPLASLKKLGTLVVSLVVVYGIVQAALGVAEAGRGMGNHDSSQMSSGLWRMGGGILMSAVGAVLAYLGLQ